jgi:hypothetical protein
MSKPLIIGFSGKKRTGKDTAANLAVNEHGFERDAFAAPIKTIAQEVFGLEDHQVYGGAKEKEDPFWGMSPRKIMQKVGTEFARGTFHEGIWVDSFRLRMQDADASRIVVFDVRFPNEVEAIKEMGGYVVRIRRPEKEPDTNWLLKKAALTFPRLADYLPPKYHQSETALDGSDDFDFTVLNNGRVQDFERVVDSLIKFIIKFDSRSHGRDTTHSNSSSQGLPTAENRTIKCKGAV